MPIITFTNKAEEIYSHVMEITVKTGSLNYYLVSIPIDKILSEKCQEEVQEENKGKLKAMLFISLLKGATNELL